MFKPTKPSTPKKVGPCAASVNATSGQKEHLVAKTSGRKTNRVSPLTPNKEQKKLVKELQDQGFNVSKLGPHLKIINPRTGGQVSIPSTPRGGSRTWLNMLKTLKLIGFDDRRIRGISTKKKKD